MECRVWSGRTTLKDIMDSPGVTKASPASAYDAKVKLTCKLRGANETMRNLTYAFVP